MVFPWLIIKGVRSCPTASMPSPLRQARGPSRYEPGLQTGSVRYQPASQLTGGPDSEAARACPREVIARGLAIDVGKIGKAKPANPRTPFKAKAAKIEKLQAALAELDERRHTVMADFDEQLAAFVANRTG